MTRKTSSPKRASADGCEVLSKLMRGWKKGRSGGEIEPSERRDEVEVCKILAW